MTSYRQGCYRIKIPYQSVEVYFERNPFIELDEYPTKLAALLKIQKQTHRIYAAEQYPTRELYLVLSGQDAGRNWRPKLIITKVNDLTWAQLLNLVQQQTSTKETRFM